MFNIVKVNFRNLSLIFLFFELIKSMLFQWRKCNLFSGFLLQLQTLFYCNLWKILAHRYNAFTKYSLHWIFCNNCQILRRAASDQRTLISSALFPDNQLRQVFLSATNYKVWVRCHSILIVSFIYLIRTHLSHSTKLWCRRTSLIVCAYFENFEIAYFKKSTSCFKPINSWLEKYGLS